MFRRWFKKKSSRTIAKDRLRVLLISDRVDCSPEMMEMMKNDIIKVISKYMEINEKEMDLHISQSVTIDKKGYSASICANVPIKTLRGKHAELSKTRAGQKPSCP
ncbi:MAG: cell division topological specificity factor MinE [Lachnospiraceae bacterium]